jgi:hypothetical protein
METVTFYDAKGSLRGGCVRETSLFNGSLTLEPYTTSVRIGINTPDFWGLNVNDIAIMLPLPANPAGLVNVVVTYDSDRRVRTGRPGGELDIYKTNVARVCVPWGAIVFEEESQLQRDDLDERVGCKRGRDDSHYTDADPRAQVWH